MCRFNLIMVKDLCSEEILKQEEYQSFNNEVCGFIAYSKGVCNCGSFVGALKDKKGIR